MITMRVVKVGDHGHTTGIRMTTLVSLAVKKKPMMHGNEAIVKLRMSVGVSVRKRNRPSSGVLNNGVKNVCGRMHGLKRLGSRKNVTWPDNHKSHNKNLCRRSQHDNSANVDL